MNNEKGFALVFEVSQGCQMGCLGCQINKDLSGLPSEEIIGDLLNLFTGLQDQGSRMGEFEFGPTDMVRAKNRREMFGHPKVKALAGLFDMLTLNASFVYVDENEYIELAKDVNAFNTSRVNGLQIPVNLRHIYNDKYLDLIERNIEVYRAALDKPLEEVIFTVILDEMWMGNVGAEINYSNLYERCRALKEKGYGFDFISHHGLRDIGQEGVKKDFVKTIRKLASSFYEKAIEHNDFKQRRFNTLTTFGETYEIVFHEGQLYVRASVSEKSNIFHDKMRYQLPWQATDILTHLTERFHQNLEASVKMSDCKECERSVDCSARFVHDVMELVGTQECLIGLKNIPIPN